MLGKPIQVRRIVRRHWRVHDRRNRRRRIPRERTCDATRAICNKSRSLKTTRPQLLSRIVKDSSPATYDRFPPRCVAEYVRNTQTRRKVVPGGLPKRRALRRERPRIRTGPLNRIGHQALGHTRRGVHFPPQPEREAETLRHSPFVLDKRRNVLVQRVSGSIGLHRKKAAIRFDIAHRQSTISCLRTSYSRERCQAAIVQAKF